MDNSSSATGGKQILCIEDEHFISELYSRALQKAGHTVTVVYSGQKGLEEARTNKYDIILLDIMVPDLLGVEVLEKLRAGMPDLKAKIVIATNLEQDEATKARVEKMADGYLIKAEITPKQLVEILNQVQN